MISNGNFQYVARANSYFVREIGRWGYTGLQAWTQPCRKRKPMTAEHKLLRTFQKLKSLDSLAGLDDCTALHYLACLVDLAARYDDPESTDKALAWAAELKSRALSATDEIAVSYFTANAWGDKQNFRHRSADEAWKWEQPETLNQILCLRRARRHPSFQQWDGVRQAQVLTNLGNQLDTLRRFVEALAHWNDALTVKPGFGMARGNRGTGLFIYGNLLFDPYHKAPFYVAAYRDLEFALSGEANFEGYLDAQAKDAFKITKERIASIADIDELERSYDLTDFSLGESEAEQRYRKWALSERLVFESVERPWTVSGGRRRYVRVANLHD